MGICVSSCAARCDWVCFRRLEAVAQTSNRSPVDLCGHWNRGSVSVGGRASTLFIAFCAAAGIACGGRRAPRTIRLAYRVGLDEPVYFQPGCPVDMGDLVDDAPTGSTPYMAHLA